MKDLEAKSKDLGPKLKDLGQSKLKDLGLQIKDLKLRPGTLNPTRASPLAFSISPECATPPQPENAILVVPAFVGF